MKELDILLEEFWIPKEKDKDLYYRIKDAIPRFKDFLEQKLGYKLIVNPYLIKLEKLPGKAESWMGIQDFDDKLEYAMLCLLLAFLEGKSAGEQFVLSEVTEFVQASFSGEEKLDWTLPQKSESSGRMTGTKANSWKPQRPKCCMTAPGCPGTLYGTLPEIL